MSRISAKFSDHHSSPGGSGRASSWSVPAAARTSARMRSRERAKARHGRIVAITRSRNAMSLRTSPGMNTLTAWWIVWSGNRNTPLTGCGLVRK